mmetsp:Transcript_17693/g.57353  ORF Transcript_17693/g.57353 Transcript_17693/m.57353 type:complete len:331 (-) Transcript_17693:153-1145(-)
MFFEEGLAVVEGLAFAGVEGPDFLRGVGLPEADVGVVGGGEEEGGVGGVANGGEGLHAVGVVDVARASDAVAADLEDAEGLVGGGGGELEARGREGDVDDRGDVVFVEPRRHLEIADVEGGGLGVFPRDDEGRGSVPGVPGEGVRSGREHDAPRRFGPPDVVQHHAPVPRAGRQGRELGGISAGAVQCARRPAPASERRRPLRVSDLDEALRARRREGTVLGVARVDVVQLVRADPGRPHQRLMPPLHAPVAARQQVVPPLRERRASHERMRLRRPLDALLRRQVPHLHLAVPRPRGRPGDGPLVPRTRQARHAVAVIQRTHKGLRHHPV